MFALSLTVASNFTFTNPGKGTPQSTMPYFSHMSIYSHANILLLSELLIFLANFLESKVLEPRIVLSQAIKGVLSFGLCVVLYFGAIGEMRLPNVNFCMWVFGVLRFKI